MFSPLHLKSLIRRWQSVAVMLLLGFSLLLNGASHSFPIGFHPDEGKKGIFVVEGTQDFKHPLLLLQLTRLVTAATGEKDPDMAVRTGRLVSAVAGMLVVWLSYKIARYGLAAPWPLVVAATVAVSPILVVHAHYLKEDVLFTACALLSLWLFLRYVRQPRYINMVWFGLALGVAFSAHYKSLLLVGLYLIVPLLTLGLLKISWWRYYLQLFGALLLAVVVFALINWPLFYNFTQFIQGVRYEADHATAGHTVAISPLAYFFSFHFLHSLMPGMTPLAAGTALIALFLLLGRWHQLTLFDRILIAYITVFYFAMEASPLKPAPDVSRYILPIVPALLYIVWRAVTFVPWPPPVRYGVIMAVTLAAILIPLYDSIQLDSHMARDTRDVVVEQLKQKGLADRAFFEAYARPRIGEEDVQSAQTVAGKLDELRKEGIAVVVTSSFQYDRYYLGAQLPNQTEAVYKGYRRYEELFSLPYVEITPEYRSYAFSNPIIRIIDIRSE